MKMKMFNVILTVFSILILCVSIFNIYLYYRDVKTIQELKKETLRLEIEIKKKQLEQL